MIPDCPDDDRLVYSERGNFEIYERDSKFEIWSYTWGDLFHQEDCDNLLDAIALARTFT